MAEKNKMAIRCCNGLSERAARRVAIDKGLQAALEFSGQLAIMRAKLREIRSKRIANQAN